jgi:hypothetical protein
MAATPRIKSDEKGRRRSGGEEQAAKIGRR